ncbi:MAG TPA: hypothetical protein VG898_07020 [Solirubrobacterales bacterium]|nr:hypothetical protein [Solirubrobacterales bacterium]
MPSARKLAILAAMLVALALPAPPASASGSGEVLIVGDSLEELTSPYVKRYLPGVPLTVDAVGGSNSFQIFDLFQESYDPSQSVIVFDAGTNDNPAYPEILAENLEKVAATVGDRCMVVPTVHGFTVNGIDNTGKNMVVRAFAAARPGTQTPDWAGAVAAHPELMQSDGLHPIAAGAELRARLIAQGIEACLGLSTASQRHPRPPALESGPDLPPARKLARREAQILDAILGTALELVPIALGNDA